MGLEMTLELPVVDGHPNRSGFRGVLTTVNRASDRPPNGTGGHRIMLTDNAAQAAIPSLLGMALSYAPEFDRHDPRCKVGVITSARIVELTTGTGLVMEIGGYLYAKDFPEIVAEIERRGHSDLGMSYEIDIVRVADIYAPVWEVMQCMFTGAAVLKRDKAAYSETWVRLE